MPNDYDERYRPMPERPKNLNRGARVRITGRVIELRAFGHDDAEVSRDDLVGKLATITQPEPFMSYSTWSYLYHLNVDGLGVGYSASADNFQVIEHELRKELCPDDYM